MANEEKRRAIKALVREAGETGLHTYCIIEGCEFPVRILTGTKTGVRALQSGVISPYEKVTNFYNN